MSEPCELCDDETGEEIMVTVGGAPVGVPMHVCEDCQAEVSET